MSRFARYRRVFFVEEPVFDADTPHVTMTPMSGVIIVVPHLRAGTDAAEQLTLLRRLVGDVIRAHRVQRPIAWFYTPMSLPIAAVVEAGGVVYDCMDELSGFRDAPPELHALEEALFDRADVVFTGGYSLFEAKRSRHPNVHPFPSGVDMAHFARARSGINAPADQESIARPRIGFCGVIDERMNGALVADIARLRPEWQIVMLGPTAKVHADELPHADNIHYLGMKAYQDLPAYLGGWDVAIMPFAHNDATRYISPTKTPEYLAAGCPVVSTGIRDVVSPYGDAGLVGIAETGETFVAAIERAMTPEGRRAVKRARPLLETKSWDATFTAMRRHVDALDETLVEAARPTVREPRGTVTPAPSSSVA